MEDRKAPLSQFRPKSLLLSTVRVVAINISSTLSTYFSDQLQSEQDNEKLVDDGEITPDEADERNEERGSREWQQRMDALPKKIGYALWRFHTCTALMRLYEFIIGRYILSVDGNARLEGGSVRGRDNSTYEHSVDIMDKLTRDPFQASLRTSQILHNQEHSPGKVLSSDGKETSTSSELYKQMYTTCLWANIIPFLAELTVQHGILLYGYGVYYMEKKRRRQEKENSDGNADEQCNDEQDEAETVDETAYALSILFRSCHLTFSRGLSWIAASVGGAAGSVIYPGWGAVFGIQIGDTSVGALLD
eukprot:scaffold8341_cov135-Skeletonema_menzelii.AAC.2